MSCQTWVFSGLDTLFFREARPMETVDGSVSQSVFPPPIRTLVGSIRTVLGEQNNIDWQAFRKEKTNHEHYSLIGYGDDLNQLKFQGPWISYHKQRIYPAPLNLMAKFQGENISELKFLEIGQAQMCDLGNKVRLPSLPKGFEGSKPLEQYWLKAEGFETVLNGQVPKLETIVSKDDLYTLEPRLGIARNIELRTAADGMLYQTCHLRLNPEVCIEVDVEGIADDKVIKNTLITRLGAEGRLAGIKFDKKPPAFPLSQMTGRRDGFVIYLMTPLRMEPTASWHPLPNFKSGESNGQTVWKGELAGLELQLITAITGKTLREGGWDMANDAPRAVQSLIPAGSAFYCTTEHDLQKVINTLHQQQIGHDQSLGRGKIAIGIWNQSQIPSA